MDKHHQKYNKFPVLRDIMPKDYLLKCQIIDKPKSVQNQVLKWSYNNIFIWYRIQVDFKKLDLTWKRQELSKRPRVKFVTRTDATKFDDNFNRNVEQRSRVEILIRDLDRDWKQRVNETNEGIRDRDVFLLICVRCSRGCDYGVKWSV